MRDGFGCNRVRGGLAPWLMRRVREYVESHLAAPLSTEALAQVAGLSTSHFCRVFKESSGFTVHEFVILRRIEKAQSLMLDTTERLSDIAVSCGMYDQAHFTHWFRYVVGETPAAWRRLRMGQLKRISCASVATSSAAGSAHASGAP